MKKIFKKFLGLFIITLLVYSNMGLHIKAQLIKMDRSGIEGYSERKKKIETYKNILNSGKKDYINCISGEIIIKFKEGVNLQFSPSNKLMMTGDETLDKLARTYGLKKVEKVFKNQVDPCFTNIYKFKFSNSIDADSISKKYSENSNVLYAQPNYIIEAFKVPNDPYYQTSGSWGQDFRDLYGLHLLKCEGAWDLSTGDSDVVIAVVDTGVDYNHPDIIDNMWINKDEIQNNKRDDDNDGFVDNYYGADFTKNNGDPIDNFGHGTHCAGIVAAVGNNRIGIVGVNWNAKIMALKGLTDYGVGCSTFLAPAIVWAADNGADVISNSWGYVAEMFTDQLIEDAIKYAYSKGCIIVFAAGNSDKNTKYQFPLNMDEVISVAATDFLDQKAEFSNWGENIDVAAPGVEILSLRATDTDMYEGAPGHSHGEHFVPQYNLDAKYYWANGTSMACPYVAGLCALILSNKNCYNLQDMVKTLILNTADEINSEKYIGRGRINAYESLKRTPAVADFDFLSDYENIEEKVELRGTAWGEKFRSYEVKYGKDEKAGTWITIKKSITSVQDGVLTILNTKNLDDGLYTIRLTVECDDGIYYDDVKVIVNNYKNTIFVDMNNANGPWDGTEEHPFKKINDGVRIAGANDEVFVKYGLYLERVYITKPIRLIGENITMMPLISSPSGTAVYINANDVEIRGFSISDSFSGGTLDLAIGVDIKSNDNKICNCEINNYDYLGIKLDYGSNNIITNCEFKNNCLALLITGGSNNIIEDSEFKNNEFCVSLENTSSNMINLCSFTSNDWPISFNGASSNTISSCIINKSVFAIILDSDFLNVENSDDNIIIWNDIFDNMYGLYIYSGYNNIIHHNNFLRNDIMNARDNCTNIWYTDENPVGGNYWDDYTGEDQNGDGFGDTPYYILEGNNQDYYPFIKPLKNFPPDKPAIDGPINGKIRRKYTYTITTTDPDGDQIYYLFDWGDGSNSGWVGPYNNGNISISHKWKKQGVYEIKAKAKDENNVESEWSDPLVISIVKAKSIDTTPVIQKLKYILEIIKILVPMVLRS